MKKIFLLFILAAVFSLPLFAQDPSSMGVQKFIFDNQEYTFKETPLSKVGPSHIREFFLEGEHKENFTKYFFLIRLPDFRVAKRIEQMKGDPSKWKTNNIKELAGGDLLYYTWEPPHPDYTGYHIRKSTDGPSNDVYELTLFVKGKKDDEAFIKYVKEKEPFWLDAMEKMDYPTSIGWVKRPVLKDDSSSQGPSLAAVVSYQKEPVAVVAKPLKLPQTLTIDGEEYTYTPDERRCKAPANTPENCRRYFLKGETPAKNTKVFSAHILVKAPWQVADDISIREQKSGNKNFNMKRNDETGDVLYMGWVKGQNNRLSFQIIKLSKEGVGTRMISFSSNGLSSDAAFKNEAVKKASLWLDDIQQIEIF